MRSMGLDGPVRCEIVQVHGTRTEAMEHETQLIQEFGRLDLGTETLFNCSDGPGSLNPSQRVRKICSETGRIRGKITMARMSPETRSRAGKIGIRNQPREAKVRGGKIGGPISMAKMPPEARARGCRIGGSITGRTNGQRSMALRVTCEHCGAMNNPCNHAHWHGDNCKKRKKD
jgi:hypothetical protein